MTSGQFTKGLGLILFATLVCLAPRYAQARMTKYTEWKEVKAWPGLDWRWRYGPLLETWEVHIQFRNRYNTNIEFTYSVSLDGRDWDPGGSTTKPAHYTPNTKMYDMWYFFDEKPSHLYLRVGKVKFGDDQEYSCPKDGSVDPFGGCKESERSGATPGNEPGQADKPSRNTGASSQGEAGQEDRSGSQGRDASTTEGTGKSAIGGERGTASPVTKPKNDTEASRDEAEERLEKAVADLAMTDVSEVGKLHFLAEVGMGLQMSSKYLSSGVEQEADIPGICFGGGASLLPLNGSLAALEVSGHYWTVQGDIQRTHALAFGYSHTSSDERRFFYGGRARLWIKNFGFGAFIEREYAELRYTQTYTDTPWPVEEKTFTSGILDKTYAGPEASLTLVSTPIQMVSVQAAAGVAPGYLRLTSVLGLGMLGLNFTYSRTDMKALGGLPGSAREHGLGGGPSKFEAFTMKATARIPLISGDTE
jgi:hypothetical protein